MASAWTVNPQWFWISFGGLLLAAELLGAGGYLLWCGIGAVLVGLLVWLIPFGWEWQGVIFALLSLLSALLWWDWLRRRSARNPNASPLLNQRGAQLIGTEATLIEPLINGVGRVRIGDTTWRAGCDTDLAAGVRVRVVAVEGITLRVRPSADQAGP